MGITGYILGIVAAVFMLSLVRLLYRTMKATEDIAATRDYLIGQLDEIKALLHAKDQQP